MFATLYIPDFSLQSSLRYEPSLRARPVAIVDDAEKPARIVQFTRAASRAGIRAGMTSSQGLARCPDLLIRYRSPDQERMAADALLQCASAFSPCVEATAEGICTLDLKGLSPSTTCLGEAQSEARINHSLDKFGTLSPSNGQPSTLLQHLRSQELIAKIGIAATPDLALLAARNAKSGRPIFHVASLSDLHALPVSALAATPEFQRILRRLGIRRLREFCELPPEGIAARFGEEGLRCWKCIAGKTTRLLKLVPTPERYEEATDFESEIELLEPLLFMLRRFLDCIAGRLAAAYLVVAVLELRIGFTAGPDYTRLFPVPSPTCNVETLFRMLFTHLESFQSPHPIKSLRLAATPGKAVKEQLGLFETSLRDPNQFHQTFARLSALVGSDRAGTPVKENTFRPDAFTLHPPAFPAAPVPARPSASRGLALRRFRPPRPAHVFTMNDRPASLVIEGLSAPLGDSSGPWITSGDWWDAHAWERTEWEVESADGRLYRIFQQANTWFIDGIYD